MVFGNGLKNRLHKIAVNVTTSANRIRALVEAHHP